MAEWFAGNGTLDVRAFSGWEAVNEFLAIEERYWSKIAKDEWSHGATVAIARIRAEIRSLRQRINQSMSYNPSAPSMGAQELVKAFDSPEGTLISTGSQLQRVRDEIEDSSTPSAALFHIAFKRGVVSLADARDPDDLTGALWDVAPGLADTAKLGRALKSERERLRQSIRTLSATVEGAEKTRKRDFELLVNAAKDIGKRWAVRRNLKMRNQLRDWRSRHEASEASIQAVEDTYKEHMGLKAPVEYWQNKADTHGRSERLLRWLVIGFFAVAIGAIVLAFWNVGWTLINLSLLPDAKPLPPGVYVVASAGLASAAAVLFWGGRLLTKLYLSQHHLRQDAEERATMTETYLALIENQAAGTEDRQVILNALFRATPDGIVKEEGGLDPSIAAALGKYLAK